MKITSEANPAEATLPGFFLRILLQDMLKEFVQAAVEKPITIAVIGDCMLDQWFNVDIDRISPEAPVPVWKSTNQVPAQAVGGAANVARQMGMSGNLWNVDVRLYGFCDKQAADTGFFDTERLIMLDSPYHSFIPRKIRYLSGNIQVGRVDIERPSYGLKDKELQQHRVQLAERLHSDTPPDAIILSDYGKGLFEHGPQFLNLSQARYEGIPVIVDPKFGPIDMWRGCTIFKPNEKEARSFAKSDDDREQACDLRVMAQCESVVVTHGDRGVTGIDGSKYKGVDGTLYFEYLHNDYFGAEVGVRSVVGAGDCFVAFLAMGIARGFSVEESSKVAFQAGKRYVTHMFNNPVSAYELLQAGDIFDSKIREWQFLPPNQVFTNGCFDIIHSGHIALLKAAKEACQPGESLIVAINSDESVRRLKGQSRPIFPASERARTLASLAFVDYVTIFDQDTPLELIKTISPRAIVKGGDYKKEEVVGNDLVREVIIIPTLEGFSTTAAIHRLETNEKAESEDSA